MEYRYTCVQRFGGEARKEDLRMSSAFCVFGVMIIGLRKGMLVCSLFWVFIVGILCF